MTDIDTERETAAAVEALIYRLRNRGDADDEPFAQEFMAALKLRGWRPTPARPSPAWDRQFGGGTDPAKVPELAAVKAQLAAMPPLPEHRGGDVP